MSASLVGSEMCIRDRSCCDVFCEQFNYKRTDLGSGKVATPFVTESAREINQCAGRCTVCNGVCCSGNFAEVRRDEQAKRLADKEARPSTLYRPAARVLMKVLYAARMARPDLFKAVCTLARSINRWRDRETKHLTRLMKYVWQQRRWLFIGWCGDKPE
eukprot:12129811-Alexandrium_andersonii.AAC.1